MWTEISPYKAVILRGARAELRNRYAGAGFGKLWNIFNPLAQIAIYVAVFSMLVPEEFASDRAGFVFRLCAGVVTWLAFAETITRCTTTFVDSATYLKKLPLPELVYPLQSILAGGIILAISWAILVVIAMVVGYPVHASWLALAPIAALFLAFGAAIGLLCGTVHAFFRDAAQGVGIVLQLWFWLSAVVIPQQTLNAGLASVGMTLTWNPAWWFLDAIKQAFAAGTWPSGVVWAVLIAIPLLAWTIALLAFAKLRAQIREVI